MVGAFLFFGRGGRWAGHAVGFWVNIRFLRCCGWRFRPYGDLLFYKRLKK